MIAITSPSSQKSSQKIAVAPAAAEPRWQRLMADAVTDPAELLNILQLDSAQLPAARAAATRFALRVPRGYVRRMRAGDVADPLLRQVLPLDAELLDTPGYTQDPVGDLAARAAPGILHKYHGRALIVTTGACAVHCRYCFRRHFPYADEALTKSDWRTALDYLRQDDSIVEVILSGGDPLSLSDTRLAELCNDIAAIGHVRRLRIHTRQPIVLPERIDSSFVRWWSQVPLQKVIVLHANHANEIDDSVRAACRKLLDCQTTLLNQSVLLAGVNDTADALAQLSESLFATGVLPYYLHALDRVQGAAHFAVDDAHALQLVQQLAATLPGYLVPKLVREIPGQPAKTPLGLEREGTMLQSPAP
jgi:L-lysine 2,3-aminomutase